MDKKVLKIAAITFFVLCAFLAAFIAFQKLIDHKLSLCGDCNIILITMTNLRYDHISANGYARPTTPNLDQLSKKALVFDNTFSHASWTLPDAISIYASLYPLQHGVMNRHDGSTLAKETPTLIDILNQAGYKTAAFTGGFDYNPKFGLTGRFHEYQECAKGQRPTYPRQSDARSIGPENYGEFGCTIPEALDWLKKNAQKKFFLHVQGFDAHCPFSQKGGKTYDKDYRGNIDYSGCLWTFDRTEPKVLDGKTYYPVFSSKVGTAESVLLSERDIQHLVALYDESITFADLEVGRLVNELKELGLWDKTIVIFTSEHGDMFGKGGRFMRGGPLRGTFYDDVLHVPLFIKYPNLGSRRIKGLVSHVDLMPTILDFLGLSSPTGISGKSLVPLITEGGEVNDYVFAGSHFTSNIQNSYFNKGTKIFSIRNNKWKLISETVFEEDGSHLENLELYDIQNDKGELNNLYESHKNIVSELKSKLPNWTK